MVKRVLVVGAGGQSGSYLCDLLVEKGYEVHGMVRRSSVDNLWRIRHLIEGRKIILHQGDLTDVTSLLRVLTDSQPEEIFNEADQDHVGWSYSCPKLSVDVTFGGVASLLELIRQVNPEVRVFQPVSATMFGDSPPRQDENSPLRPQSPYAVAKVAAWHLCQHYRQEHGMFVACGIMFNHHSIRRGEDYLLNKICRTAVEISKGSKKILALNDLTAKVDIGSAPDYMRACWSILQLRKPDDYVIASGAALSVGDLAAEAFKAAGVEGKVRDLLGQDIEFKRPGNQPILVGNYSKAYDHFGWKPEVTVQEVINELVEKYRRELV